MGKRAGEIHSNNRKKLTELKKVLIISPYFPPVNAADMQRVRMTLPYLAENGWAAEIVTVDEKYVDFKTDPLLLLSIPESIKVHKVKALPKKYTMKIGLGSIAIRSLWFYKKKVNKLLREKKFDLILFSTTQFPVCILGAYWHKKFGIPYIIDMQDPWVSTYYENKPKNEKPKKYWFSHNLNKFLEPIAFSRVGGIMSVSASYIKQLNDRYLPTQNIPSAVITFGAFKKDIEIVEHHLEKLSKGLFKDKKHTNLVYIGRGGFDMELALKILLTAFKKALSEDFDYYKDIRFYFIGTSYAPKGKEVYTLLPLAIAMGLETYVIEIPERIGFYESLNNLMTSSGTILLGSDDAAYTASKLYPNILVRKPLLALLNKLSSASRIFNECNAGKLITFEQSEADSLKTFKSYIYDVKNEKIPQINEKNFDQYSAEQLTKEQINLFNKVINKNYH